MCSLTFKNRYKNAIHYLRWRCQSRNLAFNQIDKGVILPQLLIRECLEIWEGCKKSTDLASICYLDTPHPGEL